MSSIRRLPEQIRQNPQVSDAWHLEHSDMLSDHHRQLTDHDHRISRLESVPTSASPTSLRSTPDGENLLPVGYFRPTLLVVTIGVVSGLITVEQAIKILSFLFGG